MKEILFATSNKAKIAQFQFVANARKADAQIVSVYERFPELGQYDENYPTQEEIVEQGSLEIFNQIHQPVVVEDSIVEVDALGGKPGLVSNGYLKEHGMEGLLAEMDGQVDRVARIVSCVAYRDADRYRLFKHVVTGEIAPVKRHREGEPNWVGPTFHPFGGGFNAIFYLPNPKKTIAELTAAEGLKFGYREPNFIRFLAYLKTV